MMEWVMHDCHDRYVVFDTIRLKAEKIVVDSIILEILVAKSFKIHYKFTPTVQNTVTDIQGM